MPTISESLSTFASGLRLDAVPQHVRATARLHALDALGCGLAAIGLGTATAVREVADRSAEGAVSAMGVPHGVSSYAAALSNGVTCHALDFDDTHTGAIAHVSAVIVPSVLAVAEEIGATGAEALAAIVAGNEVTLRLGLPIGSGFHAVGFHPTSVLGVFGATAAIGRLRRLDAETLVQAFGIAGSLAAGVLEHVADGSATKRLHAGFAARSALLAVELAQGGETGPRSIIEGRFGLYNAFARMQVDPDELGLERLGDEWLTSQIAFKPYPACHFMHAAIDAARAAQLDGGVDADDIDEVIIEIPQAVMPIVAEPQDEKRRPRTEYDAKFSVPFSVATMLRAGTIDVTSYTQAAIADPGVLALAAKVRSEPGDFASFGGAFPGAARIVAGGHEHVARLDVQRGGPDDPIADDEVLEKFRTNAALATSTDAAASVERAVLAMDEQQDVGWMRVLRDARPA